MNDAYYFATSKERPDFFGASLPTAGAHVTFDEAKLYEYGPRSIWPIPYRRDGALGLVVFFDPLDVMTWPCRLWKVHDLVQPTTSMKKPFYLHCQSFEVLEEIPSWQVLGAHGAAVARLIDEASDLTQAQVDVIGTLDSLGETRTEQAVLQAWRARLPSPANHRPPLAPYGTAWDFLSTAVESAAARTDSHLFGWVEGADRWPLLADPAWEQARRAALAAALAISVPDLLTDDETNRLTRRWRMAIPEPGVT
ncbi:hypothetical protein AB0368_09050 [Actinoplanes sp. NPDC051475]|uniref:hypothetical protein n=1 Tax=Actinoplanes sp. NPDC051475 TaxID=3157225 RepID=UPI00344D0D6F